MSYRRAIKMPEPRATELLRAIGADIRRGRPMPSERQARQAALDILKPARAKAKELLADARRRARRAYAAAKGKAG
jgi:cell division septum initiation protein DivIVA